MARTNDIFAAINSAIRSRPSGKALAAILAMVLVGIASTTVAAAAGPIAAAPPDTIEGYYAITSTGGVAAITAAQTTEPPFASADVGKLITCTGLGAAGVDQGVYVGKIAAVTSGSKISLSPAPTLGMSATSQRCAYGGDQTANLQAAFTKGQTSGLGSIVPAGHYLVLGPLTCLPPPTYNNLAAPAPLCNGDPGAVITAMASMTSLMTFGSANSNYLGHLDRSSISGLSLDCNFVALYCADFPLGIGTRVTLDIKNPVLGGIRYGNIAAGTVFDSSQTLNSVLRRYYYGVVGATITYGATTTVTTPVDHGFTSGRVVNFDEGGVANAPLQLFASNFRITVTGARSFTLNDTNSSTWVAPKTVTFTNGGPNISSANHALAAGQRVMFSTTGALPTHFSAGTNYFVLATGLGPSTFEVATTPSGPPIVAGSQGSGAQTAAIVMGPVTVSETQPGTPFPFALSGISVGTTTTLTTAVATGWPNGSSICVYNVGGTSRIDGRYAAATISGRNITIDKATSGVATVANAYVVLCPVVNVASNPAAVGILYENAADIYELGNQGYGFVFGSYAALNGGGYDGTYIGDHWYNYPQNGVMFAGYVVAGHNRLIGVHTDCPTLFALEVTRPVNDIAYSEMDCAGFLSLPNNITNFVRVEPGGSATLHGGSLVATSARAAINAPVSTMGTSAGATTGPGNLYGDVPGYAQFGLGNVADTPFVTYPQPDTSTGSAAAAETGKAGEKKSAHAHRPAFTIHTLPKCDDASYGAHAIVSDGVASPAFLSVVKAPGGSVTEHVWCNGADWVYGG